jgi:hypothetical protein
MDNANLGSIIKNDKARQAVYAVWFLVGIAIGATQAWYADPDPEWLSKAFDVWSYVGLYVSALALANAKSTPNIVYAPAANPDTINADNVILSGGDNASTDVTV